MAEGPNATTGGDGCAATTNGGYGVSGLSTAPGRVQIAPVGESLPGRYEGEGNVEEQELLAKLELLELESETIRNNVTCGMIGHSKIQTHFFGYYYCARCGEQVGDTLGGYYPQASEVVVVGHKCDKCVENYKSITWMDKLFCPDPFADDPEQQEDA